METAELKQVHPAAAAAQTAVKMVFDRWHSLVKAFSASIDALSDEQLEHEIAPGRNRGIYLLGHMVAVHDDMMRLLGFGDKFYPELFQPFIESPDKAVAELPSAQSLRAAWNKMNETLNTHFEQMQPEDWFEQHTAVSAEDFAREPHRNKLNIMLTRSTHMAYHHGQLILIK
jgi:hypothetical protein